MASIMDVLIDSAWTLAALPPLQIGSFFAIMIWIFVLSTGFLGQVLDLLIGFALAAGSYALASLLFKLYIILPLSAIAVCSLSAHWILRTTPTPTQSRNRLMYLGKALSLAELIKAFVWDIAFHHTLVYLFQLHVAERKAIVSQAIEFAAGPDFDDSIRDDILRKVDLLTEYAIKVFMQLENAVDEN